MDDPYEFKIILEEKRGKTEARLALLRDGMEHDPTEESGIGIVDIAALALRVACVILQKPALRRVIIMDEPFRCVDDIKIQKLRFLLQELSKELEVQFILVTHEKKLRIGKVIEIT